MAKFEYYAKVYAMVKVSVDKHVEGESIGDYSTWAYARASEQVEAIAKDVFKRLNNREPERFEYGYSHMQLATVRDAYLSNPKYLEVVTFLQTLGFYKTIERADSATFKRAHTDALETVTVFYGEFTDNGVKYGDSKVVTGSWTYQRIKKGAKHNEATGTTLAELQKKLKRMNPA